MKVIFLDIDGVLNCERTKARAAGGMLIGIDKQKVRLLKRIIDETGAEVVLTSTWKDCWEPNRRSTEQPDPLGKYLANKLFAFKIKPIGKTKEPYSEARGVGVHDWLWENKDVDGFVILDDSFYSDYSKDLIAHLVHTKWSDGLTPELAEEAIRILKEV